MESTPDYTELFSFANFTRQNSRYVKKSLQQKFKSLRAKLKMRKQRDQECKCVTLTDCELLEASRSHWAISSAVDCKPRSHLVCQQQSVDNTSRTSTPIASRSQQISSSRLHTRAKSMQKHRDMKLKKRVRAKVDILSVVYLREDKRRPLAGGLIERRFLLNMLERSMSSEHVPEFENFGEFKVWFV